MELELVSETKGLADALSRERGHAIDGRNLGKSSSRYQHLPVRLAPPDRLQIDWSVVPNAQTLLDALTRHTLVRPAEESMKDFANLTALSREEQEARLLQLAESGDKIGAIALAQRLCRRAGWQAKQDLERSGTLR